MSVLLETYPVLYSFRRCPYAMRARLSLVVSKTRVEIREVLLKKKPKEFLDVSASATVPCLITNEEILDESMDIMYWALKKSDPQNWLKMPKLGNDLIKENDTSFKHYLDLTKYHIRYPRLNPKESRIKASAFLIKLESIMVDNFLFGPTPTIADMSILPFVRQFANTDLEWFDNQNWPRVKSWLYKFIGSEIFHEIQIKFVQWQTNSKPCFFPN
tara:strand:+ start:59 stop:703 length:645 start_codon:yes stop_codon:yes gene_type:complete